jgi:hypothetical protein
LRTPGTLPHIPRFLSGPIFLAAILPSHRCLSIGQFVHLVLVRHQVVAGVTRHFFLEAGQTWAARWEEWPDCRTCFLRDTRLDRKTGPVTGYFDVRNIIDDDYTKVGGVPVPERCFSLGRRQVSPLSPR